MHNMANLSKYSLDSSLKSDEECNDTINANENDIKLQLLREV